MSQVPARDYVATRPDKIALCGWASGFSGLLFSSAVAACDDVDVDTAWSEGDSLWACGNIANHAGGDARLPNAGEDADLVIAFVHQTSLPGSISLCGYPSTSAPHSERHARGAAGAHYDAICVSCGSAGV